MSDENLGTIWVCVCCLMNHANGECGCQGNDDNAHKLSRDERGRYDGGTINNDGIPLSLITRGYSLSMGMAWQDHSEDCLTYVINDLRERFPDVDWPETPGDYECECETNSYSTSQCEGCGTYLHGERHGMTLFKTKRPRRPAKPTPAIVTAPAPSVDELVALIDSPPPTHCGQCSAPVDQCACCRHCGLAFGH